MVNNLALLLSLGIVYDTGSYVRGKFKRFEPYLNGLLIGLIGLLIMSVPLKYPGGVILDTRSVLISVTALVFGAVPTIIASAVITVYRIIIGGTGWLTGAAVIIACTAVGLLWRKYFFNINAKLRWVNLLCFGAIIHTIILVFILVFLWPVSIDLIQKFGAPLFATCTVGTVILSLLLIHQKERHEALLKLSETEARYKSLFNNSHTAMLLISPEDGQVIEANPVACAMLGYSCEALTSMNMFQVITAVPDEAVTAMMQNMLSGEKNHFIFSKDHSDRETNYVELFCGPVEIERRLLLFSIAYDVTNRVRSEHALAESENRFRMLVENAPDAIFIQTGMKFAYVNPRAVALFGAQSPEDLIGKRIMERIHPDFRNIVFERAKGIIETQNIPKPLEEVYLRLDGTSISVDVTAVPVRYRGANGAVVFSRDISERKLEEFKLRQQQKLEAIGILAGGVAHEVNNPINGIMNYAELMLDDLQPDSRAANYAHEIIHESERISRIVKNLLQFSRHEELAFSFEAVPEIIDRSLTLIKALIRKDQIDLQVEIEEDLPRIRCRSQQIQQVLINLITNARDALNERYPGYHSNKILRLMCRLNESAAKKRIRVVIEDHGNGISRQISERIFEPFFSTKARDKGTGLGLSISFGIISDHKGTINVESEEGAYTRFIIDLPIDPFPQEVSDE